MGEMNVKGYAEKKIECDIVEYTLVFYSEGNTIPKAIKSVNDELERFLTLMEEKEITPDMFRIEENLAGKKYCCDDNEPPFEAKRKITLRIPLVPASVDFFIHIISDQKFNMTSHEEYICSNLETVHNDLLKLAVENSRKKAELIASISGKKIVGIKSVDTSVADRTLMSKSGAHYLKAPENPDYKAAKLKAPTIDESEEVEIIWLIED